MADVINLTKDVWTLVAANTTLKVVKVWSTSPSQYLYVTRAQGQPAPTDNTAAQPIKDEAKISNSSPVDIYVKAVRKDGAILIDSEIVENVRQDNTSAILDIYFSEKLKEDITLTQDTVPGTEPGNFVFNVSAGHGFTGGGEWLEIWENGYFAQVEVESVNVDAVTVALPIERVWTTSAVVKRVNVDMNVDGTAPRKFTFSPIGTSWDVTRFILNMTHASAGDDSKFGSLPALTNGVYARRKNNGSGTFGNLFNSKTNGEFRTRAYDLNYSDKAGGGLFGTSVRRSFNGDDKNGAVVRVDGASLVELEAWIRDNISTLSSFRVILQGSAVTG